MSIPTQPDLPFWHDLPELGDVPDLTPDDLYRIALRQTYSLGYWLDRCPDTGEYRDPHHEERWLDNEARTDGLLAEDNARILAQLEDDCIDHEALEQWYESQTDIPY
jgi:hypothetical protein